MDRRSGPRLWIVGLLLALATVGCWSSDTLFIKLTATPPPLPTATLGAAVAGAFAVGESATVIGAGVAPVYLTRDPEPVTRRNRAPGAACYGNSTVEILAVEQVDGVTYYQVNCNAPGWLTADDLEAAGA